MTQSGLIEGSPETERGGRGFGASGGVRWRPTDPPLLSSRTDGDEFEPGRGVALSIEAGVGRRVSVQCRGVLGWGRAVLTPL